MSPLENLARVEVDGAPLVLHRAWPRGPRALVLEYRPAGDPHGPPVAGQWDVDDDALDRVVDRTPGSRRADGAGPVLHLGGADRRLPALAPLLARPGVRLVAHRAERRAVVVDGSSHVKVVRPGRAASVAAAGEALPDDEGLRRPQVLEVDDSRGLVRTATLPGRPLGDLLVDREVRLPVVVAAARHVGRALRVLAARDLPTGLPVHGPDREAEVLRGWVDLALAHRVVPDDLAPVLQQQAADAERLLLGSTPAPATLVHRDLHDGQVLVDDGGAPALLDADTAAVGERSLDLANLATHLHWRAVVSGHPQVRERAEVAVAALADVAAPDVAGTARIRAATAATAARLAAVHAFRPSSAAAVRRWLTSPAPTVSVLPI